MNDATYAYSEYRQWADEPIAGRPDISVVIPAYNEALRILPTIGAIAAHMSTRGQDWELVVSDDGSTDDTVALVTALGLRNLTVITKDRNRGKGDSVRRGVLAARGRFILFADADQSTPIEQFDTLYDHMIAGADVVVGSRAAAGADVESKSVFRKILSGGLRLIVSAVFGLKVADSQCGFKLFTAEAARRLFSTQIIDGFSFDLELLYLANKLGMSTVESPVQWIDAPGSTVDAMSVSAQFIRDLVAIKLNDIRGLYEVPATPAQISSIRTPSTMTMNESEIAA